MHAGMRMSCTYLAANVSHRSYTFDHWIYFNNQKRKVSDRFQGHWMIPPVECYQYCDEYFEGMVVPNDDGAWGARWGMAYGGKTLWRESTKELFWELDDMCWDCK